MRTILLFVAMGTLVLLATTRIQAKTSQLASAAITITGNTSPENSLSYPTGERRAFAPETTPKETAKERFLKIKQRQLDSRTALLSTDGIPLGAPFAICNVADSLALVDLYNSTNGSGWTNSTNWLTGPVYTWGEPINQFFLNPATGRIEQIYLDNNNLQGNIPASIGNLTALNYLDLSDNILTGVVPDEIGNLELLGSLILTNNQLTGTFPSTIGNLIYLFEFYISQNMFTGELPVEIANIESLFYFDVSSNEFSGNVLDNITALSYLEKVDISYNQFSGTIPNEIGNLAYLNNFYIDGNQFVFKDIIPIFDWDNFGNFDFRYSDQAQVGTGSTIEVFPGESFLITIDGYDADGNDEFLWYLNGSPLFTETSSSLSVSAATRAHRGDFYCEIINSSAPDLTLYSMPVTVNVKNVLPLANAGPDQTKDENTVVTLDGSASTDDDNDPLTYAWTAPEGIYLNDYTAEMPTFTAPEVTHDTTYTISLVVYDGFDYSQRDTVLITVKHVNKIPVANAGVDQIVDEGDEVTLNGSASTDGDGDPLTYEWEAPLGITLSDNTLESPTFTAPEVAHDTTYVFLLRVNDTFATSQPDTVLITVKQVNITPVANAGVDQIVDEGDEVTLDGSASSDGDNDILAYEWTAPAGITLSDNTLESPTFTAPEVTTDTTYTFVLVVFDGTDYSTPDNVLITVRNIEIAVPETLAVTDTIVETSFTACFDALQSIVVAANGNPVVFGSGSTVDLIAGQRIQFLPGFHANSGSHVHAHISDVFCAPAGAPAQQAISEKGAVIGNEFPNKKLTGIDKSVKIYPNPTNGKITVELTNYDKMAQIDIYNTLGSRVYSTSTIRSVDLNLSHVEKGLYVVRITSDESVQTRKVLKD